MVSNSEGGLKKHIETRLDRGKKWRSQVEEHKKLALAEVPRYIRILGGGFRPVSIGNVNPCGHLLDNVTGRKIEGSSDLEKAIKQSRFVKIKPPGARKLEHQIQAFLIRAALGNEENFGRFGHMLPGFADIFDDLIFVTDELAVKRGAGKTECRADIIALGGKDGRYFPIFIELKNKRTLGKLKDQLNNACAGLWQDEQIRGPFSEFLSAVSGVPLDKISNQEEAAKKMIIWPKSRSGNEAKERINKADKEDFFIAEFEIIESESSYKFVRRIA